MKANHLTIIMGSHTTRKNCEATTVQWRLNTFPIRQARACGGKNRSIHNNNNKINLRSIYLSMLTIDCVHVSRVYRYYHCMGKQILVTTGATVTFVPLIRAVISEQFVEEVSALGYTDLVVQYGGDITSVRLVEELLSQLHFVSDNDTKESRNVFKGTLVKGKLRIVALQWAIDLVENYTCKSSVVISHAGVGSLMDTLRSWERDDNTNDDKDKDAVSRRLIAVPNESLLDNHQLEVATAFARLGALRVVSVPPLPPPPPPPPPTGESLAKALTKSLAEPWTTTPLPKAAGAVVGRVIRDELARI